MDGEKFIPISKMITHGFCNTFWYDKEQFSYQYLYKMDYELLIEWHFDVYKLIDQGLAVDMNTINNK